MEYSPNWTPECKQRFIALLPEIRALVSGGDKHISQEKFGNIFGVRGSTVQSWQEGSIPETPKLEKMANILNWSLDEFVYYLRTGEKPSEKSELQKLIYKIENLPLTDVALIVEVGAKRLASEVANFYKAS